MDLVDILMDRRSMDLVHGGGSWSRGPSLVLSERTAQLQHSFCILWSKYFVQQRYIVSVQDLFTYSKFKTANGRVYTQDLP